MSATTRSVVVGLKTALSTRVDGTGLYATNLTADGQVLIGKFDRPPGAVPFVCIEPAEVSDTDATAKTMESKGSFIVRGWVVAAPKSGEDKCLAALDLGDDIRRAIRASVGELGTIKVSTAFSPLSPETTTTGPGAYGFITAVVSATWREDR